MMVCDVFNDENKGKIRHSSYLSSWVKENDMKINHCQDRVGVLEVFMDEMICLEIQTKQESAMRVIAELDE